MRAMTALLEPREDAFLLKYEMILNRVPPEHRTPALLKAYDRLERLVIGMDVEEDV